MHHSKTHTGFTIVELLIVVVVIAILAAVTLVAYNGIRERATVSQVQSGLSQANKKILAYAAMNGDRFPDDLATVGVTNTDSTAYQYTSNNTGTPRYALTASNGVGGAVNFYLTNTQTSITSGIAPGHNLIPWRKPQAETSPVLLDSAVTIDETVTRNGQATIRIAANGLNKRLRTEVFEGTPGQVLSVRLWVLSGAGWNGMSNNSKIRFGSAVDGSIIGSCSYSGEKITWTEIPCNFTFTTGNPRVVVTIGNDGTNGPLWFDDIRVSIQ